AAAAVPGRAGPAGVRAVGSAHAAGALRRGRREGARGQGVGDPLRAGGRRAGGRLGHAQLWPGPVGLARPRRQPRLIGAGRHPARSAGGVGRGPPRGAGPGGGGPPASRAPGPPPIAYSTFTSARPPSGTTAPTRRWEPIAPGTAPVRAR